MRLKSKQANPLNTPANLKVHNSASPLKAFRVTSDTTQKKIFREGQRMSRTGPAPSLKVSIIGFPSEINRKYDTHGVRNIVVRVWRV